ncbi:MAG: GNAT family N-acetyltransferase [Solobacterium sp.]|nr:GNAT family N-acetyltransferase [Solobacterium sp.]
MDIVIKKMETDDEIRGKAYVHCASWHEAYAGMIDRDYLAGMTTEKCEAMAFRWKENCIVAKDADQVIGFAAYGHNDADYPETGEITALYVLSAYYGRGIGRRLMEAALKELGDHQCIRLWVLKENRRAIRFYEKCGFRPDGTEAYLESLKAFEIRMVLQK